MKQKIFISMNMAQSIDGKIATQKRGPVKLGSLFDSKRMQEVRAEHDVVVMGANTFAAHPMPLLVGKKSLRVRRLRAGKTGEPATAIVSSRLDFPANTPWEKSLKTLRIVFCGHRPKRAALERLRKNGVFVCIGQSERPSAAEMAGTLGALGFRQILLEGGGELNASFFDQGLVDRLYVTLCPILIGGSQSPTFFEGKGFEKTNFRRFSLKHYLKRRDELYLIYDRN